MPEGIILPGLKTREEGIVWCGECINIGLRATHTPEILYHRAEDLGAELIII